MVASMHQQMHSEIAFGTMLSLKKTCRCTHSQSRALYVHCTVAEHNPHLFETRATYLRKERTLYHNLLYSSMDWIVIICIGISMIFVEHKTANCSQAHSWYDQPPPRKLIQYYFALTRTVLYLVSCTLYCILYLVHYTVSCILYRTIRRTVQYIV